jgi:hypothetical protein
VLIPQNSHFLKHHTRPGPEARGLAVLGARASLAALVRLLARQAAEAWAHESAQRSLATPLPSSAASPGENTPPIIALGGS